MLPYYTLVYLLYGISIILTIHSIQKDPACTYIENVLLTLTGLHVLCIAILFALSFFNTVSYHWHYIPVCVLLLCHVMIITWCNGLTHYMNVINLCILIFASIAYGYHVT